MGEACIEAKAAASMMSSLTDIPINDQGDSALTERANIIRAARALLAAVTRVLIITDMVVVKRLIAAARKVGAFEDLLVSYKTITLLILEKLFKFLNKLHSCTHLVFCELTPDNNPVIT